MPIPVECPECGARNRFPDHLAGKSGRCKSCGERIPVRRSKKKSKKKSHSGGLGLVVGAVVGGVVVIVGLIAFLMMSGGHEDGIANNEGNASSSTDEASLDPIAGQTADSGDTNPPMDSAPPPIAQTGTKDVSPSTESGFTPSEPNSSKSSPSSGFQPPAASGAGLTFAKSGNWAVAPDSAARPESIDVSRFRPIKVGKDMLRGSGVVFPPAASSFVAVRTGPSNKARYSISDLTTGKEVGNA
ncbi:MAG: hypothetical protein KDA80_24940, partial [Planctomycetaceae bacterium]|nr:hypothetical protein [Planctomycetaceae bacterium]